jgi:hypothetical protein
LAIPAFRVGLLITLVFYVGNASLYFVLALQLQQVLARARDKKRVRW